MPRARNLGATLAVLALLTGSAQATTTARLHVAFSPEQLGHGTNVAFSLHIATSAGQVPEPLIAFDIRYPEQLGVAVSGLGIVTCPQARLEADGPRGCPADSRMGQGTAIAEVPFGPQIVREAARITIFAAPESNGHLGMTFYAIADAPVLAEVALPGSLLPTPAPFETIHVEVPLVQSFPEGPDVAVTDLSANIGPRGITYYEQGRHGLVAYKPRGVLLPTSCPHGGFRFQAALTFAAGRTANASTTVACPRGAR